jgi:hypothetical protein
MADFNAEREEASAVGRIYDVSGSGRKRRACRSLTPLLSAVLATVAMLVIGVGSAHAYENVKPGFEKFEVTPTTTQAGGHPDVSLNYEYRVDSESECESKCLYGRRTFIHWPSGFIGNPHVAPKCTLTEFSIAACPSDAQVGYFTLSIETIELIVPIYNMETNPEQAGLLAFTAPLISFPVFIELSSRTESDYGLDADSTPQLRLPFSHFRIVLWGVPAAEEHAWARFVTPMSGGGFCFVGLVPGVEGCPPGSAFGSETYAAATVPPAPFLQNPTTCGVPLTIVGEEEYYGGEIGKAEQPWPETTSCNQASFTPSVTAKPTTSASDTPSGLDSELRVPQTQSPITPSPSELKSARVTLPQGFSINPSAADGKVACSESLSAIGTRLAAMCPEASKIGTLMLNVAALPEPIPGALYLVQPKPSEPYRVLLAASGFATNVKLLGTVEANQQTGQVSVVFGSLPQAPLEEFDLHIFGSERGLLATPPHCGTYSAEGEFVPWNTQLLARHTSNSITIDEGPGGSSCPVGPRPYSPKLEAGVEDPRAGIHSPFTLVLTRNDSEQDMTGITVATPPGFAATLAGVAYCPEADIARLHSVSYTGRDEQSSPACPASSRVGSAVASAGAGDHPVYTRGNVYLAGPYKGAPLSLVVVIPAVSGPYDLGNVAVRAAVNVNPVTAQVSVASDPLPQILEGIPLRARSIRVELDRPHFTINPTNCDPFTVQAWMSGDEGGQATPSSRFQAADCAGLSFGPRLGIKLRGSTKHNGNPALRAVLRTKEGEANLARTVVTVPHSEFLEQTHIRTICTRVEYAQQACPNASIYGYARAFSPLLERPLEGPVYLRSSTHKLPDLVADLKGQIDIEVSAHVSSVKGRLRTTFDSVPDAPVSAFVLSLDGGKKSLLVNSRNLCSGHESAAVKMVGQNGKRLSMRTRLQTRCGNSHRRRRARRRHMRENR